MEKIFEDYFTELQTDMVSICLEYVERRAEKIFIYCSYEANTLASGFFFKVNGKVVKKNKLNEAILGDEKPFDVSIARQKGVINIINNNIIAIKDLCQEYQREMPTQIKLIYDVLENKLNVEYCYELVYSNDSSKTAYDIVDEWYELEKNII